jgi:hypothetical protein
VLIGRSRDRDGMETGVIETGGTETLYSSREGGAVMVATAEVMLGDTAEQARSSDSPRNEYENLIVMRR